MSCDVKFKWFLPKDTTKPWILLYVNGTHSHPPPPPIKIPSEILSGILKALQRINDPDETFGEFSSRGVIGNYSLINIASFIQHPYVRELCQQFQGKSFAEIHASLGNADRIRWIIKKSKILHYPSGSSRLGVLYEWQIRHKGQDDAVSTAKTSSLILDYWSINHAL